MRRLPVYLLMDTSGSMRGEPIESVKVGLQSLISGLLRDSMTLEIVYVSIIGFDRTVSVLMPLTSILEFVVPPIHIASSGPKHLGLALGELCLRFDSESINYNGYFEGDWKPFLLLMTNGSPSDVQKYREMIPEVHRRGFEIFVYTIGSKVKKDDLALLTNVVVGLDPADSSTFDGLFRYISQMIVLDDICMVRTGTPPLPPPPPEIEVFI